jgi:hypothetical protein
LNSGAGGYYNYATGRDSVPGRDMSEISNPGNNLNYKRDPYPIDSAYYTAAYGPNIHPQPKSCRNRQFGEALGDAFYAALKLLEMVKPPS